MKLGDRVCCSQYVKRSGNHYVVYKPEETLSGIEEAVYCENGIEDKEAVDEELKWNLVKTVSKAGNKFGNLLDEMLSESGVVNTQQLTSEQAIRYCERHGIRI